MVSGVGVRWLSLISSLYLGLIAGCAYCFGTYSPTIKHTLGYSQPQINMISSLGNVGMYFGIAGGLCFDNFGPPITAIGGALLVTVGHILAFLALQDYIKFHPWWLMALFFIVAWQGAGWCDTCSMSTNVRNFSRDKGKVVGLLKSFYGLSGSLLTTFYVAFYQSSPTWFLLFLGCSLGCLGLLCSPVVKLTKESGRIDSRGLRRLLAAYGLVLFLAAFTAIMSSLHNHVDGTSTISIAAAVCTVVLLVLMMGTVMAPSQIDRAPTSMEIEENSELLAGSDPTTARRSSTTDERAKLSIRDTPLSVTICTADFWMLFFAMFSSVGGGLMLINNIAQIKESLGREKDASELVTVISVLNCIGRMAAGWLCDLQGANRPALMSVALMVMAGGQAVWLLTGPSSPDAMLYAGCAICGLAYGAIWAIVPTLCADLFGTTHYGANYNGFNTAAALGGLTLNAGLAGYVYHHHADGANSCVGRVCYQLTFAACCGMTLLGGMLCLVVAWRTRGFYGQTKDLAE